MLASKVTQYGIPTSEGGRACQLVIGKVRVFLTGPETDETKFVAESLRAYWNADSEPDAPVYTTAADCVAALCVRLLRGPVVSSHYSVGPWTPAVGDGWSWAVLDKAGKPLLLAHDSFEVALYFCQLEEGAPEPIGAARPILLPTDDAIAEATRLENWETRFRFICP